MAEFWRSSLGQCQLLLGTDTVRLFVLQPESRLTAGTVGWKLLAWKPESFACRHLLLVRDKRMPFLPQELTGQRVDHQQIFPSYVHFCEEQLPTEIGGLAVWRRAQEDFSLALRHSPVSQSKVSGCVFALMLQPKKIWLKLP